jgi:hypothetical protein
MPRDEPVGSLGRLALKPTKFRDQLSMVGFPVLHDVPPRLDDSIREATNSLAKRSPS